MKFVFVDSQHNIFHWLVVVLIRVVFSLFWSPISAYLAAIGFLLSSETLQPYFPSAFFAKVGLYLAQLPYFTPIRDLILSQLNHWYKDAPVWWTMVVGIPLMLVGMSLFLINLFNLYYALFSPAYSHTHCPFCKQPIR